MPFSNSEKPIEPIGKVNILGCRNRHPKHMQIHSEISRPTYLFHEKTPKYALETNTKSMRFSNSEKPIKPIGKVNILGCRNRHPKPM